MLKSHEGKKNQIFNTAQSRLTRPDCRYVHHGRASNCRRQDPQRGRFCQFGSLAVEPRLSARVYDAANLEEVLGQTGISGLLANINSGRSTAGAERAANIWTSIFTPDYHGVFTVGGDESILWDISSGRQKMAFSRQGGVGPRPASHRMASTLSLAVGKAVRIWNAETGLPERKLEGHRSLVNDAAFSPDGNSIVTASNDKTAILWEVASGRIRHTFAGHSGARAPSTAVPTARRLTAAAHCLPGWNCANLGFGDRKISLRTLRAP